MTEAPYEITVGSKYLIRSAEDEDTIGVFAGYSMIGSESALVIRMDGGKIRFFMTSQITFMDLLESSGDDERSKKKPEPFYG